MRHGISFLAYALVAFSLTSYVIPHLLLRYLGKGVIRAAGGTYFRTCKTANLSLCSITFDDGPDPRFTPAILDILKEYSCKATFFVLAEKCQRYPELFERIRSEGHEIGLHGYNHLHPWLLGPLGTWRTLATAAKAVFGDLPGHSGSIVPSGSGQSVLYRPPWGFWSLWNCLLTKNFTRVMWSIPGNDWKKTFDAYRVARNVLENLFPGAIILLHDGGPYSGKTVAALPLILEGIRNMGYVPVTVQELLGRTNEATVSRDRVA
ncbi:MAG TPA: polysaccharide deacetylase family protein [Firmicutes bacterium]|nr:polysaccharide deacetylase family protein [Candidatus Fermentithermobacillaceae bacterium]